MKIGIVTVTYNSEHVLDDFFKSIQQQDYKNFLLFFIDNASSDKSVEHIKSWDFPNKVLVENEQNLGIATGNNQGIKLAVENDCDFVLLLNNDTVFESSLLSKLLNTQSKYSSSVVVPKMNYFSPPNKIWYAGGFYNRNKAFLNYHRGQGELDTQQYNEDDIVDYAPSCCVLIHKKVFEDIGNMDEKYFVYFDDADFFYRLKLDKRHKIRYIHDVEFFHKIGSLTKSRSSKGSNYYSEFFIKQNCKNHVYFLKKNEPRFLFICLIQLWFYMTLRFFFSSNFEKKWSTFKLIQSSYFRGLKM